MKKVIFICHGNIFRSQVAEALYNQLKKDDSLAESYGTNVADRGLQNSKIGELKGLEILISELRKYDLDISDKYPKQLKEEYLKDADKIIVLAEREFIPDWLKKYEYEYWENVPNPEVHMSEEITNIVKLIRDKIVELIK